MLLYNTITIYIEHTHVNSDRIAPHYNYKWYNYICLSFLWHVFQAFYIQDKYVLLIKVEKYDFKIYI